MNIKYEPTTASKWSRKFSIFGGILLLTYGVIFSFRETLPLDFKIVYVFELISFLEPIFLLGLSGILIGFVLNKLKWRKGRLDFRRGSLNLYGDETIVISKDSILDVYEFVGDKRKLRIDSKCYDLIIKFSTEDDLKKAFKKIEL